MMRRLFGQSGPIVDVSGTARQGARPDQQDAFRTRWITTENAWLLVLADGMGGHVAGGVASKIAVDSFVAEFVAARRSGTEVNAAFHQALDDANVRIGRAQFARPEIAGMGTTLAAVLVSPVGLTWISVGDSPLWLHRSGTLSRLNEDHSLRHLAQAEAQGVSNVLQSALTGQPIPMIDCSSEPMPLRAGDLILLASDGILTLPDKAIRQILDENASRPPDALVGLLCEAIERQKKKKQDNYTLIVTSISENRRRSAFFASMFTRWSCNATDDPSGMKTSSLSDST